MVKFVFSSLVLFLSLSSVAGDCEGYFCQFKQPVKTAKQIAREKSDERMKMLELSSQNDLNFESKRDDTKLYDTYKYAK